MEDWRINIDPVLLEAYEMAMAEIRGEDLELARARILRDLKMLSEARKRIAAKKMQFGMDTALFEKLGLSDDAPDEHEDTLSKDLSATERLFFRLWSNKQLNVRKYEKGDIIISKTDMPEFGYVIIAGTVTASAEKLQEKIRYTFGPGSVFCMAEGLASQQSSWDIVANDHVAMQCIPIRDALDEAKTLNQGLKGVCRFTVMRILNLKQAPRELL